MKYSHQIIGVAFLLISNGLFAQYVLDEDFKGGGSYLYANETKGFVSRKVIADNDQYIIAGGYRKDNGFNSILQADSVLQIIRLKGNGDLDPTFGENGQIATRFPEPVQVKSVLRHAGGYLISLLQGSQFNQTNALNFIIRITETGEIDSSFAENGIFDPKPFDFFQVCSDSIGNIYGVSSENSTGDSQIIVHKITPLGAVDTDFGSNGSVKFPITQTKAENILASHNSLYVICESTLGGKFKYRVLKMSFSGELISNYGMNGIAESTTYEFDFGIPVTGHINSTLSGEKLYIGGQSNNPDFPNHICAINSNGQKNLMFGDSGIIYLNSVAMGDFITEDNGGILMLDQERQNHKIIRIDMLGNRDENFGTNGALTASISNFTEEFPLAMNQTQNGFIVAGISVMNGDSMALSISKFKRTKTSIADIESPKFASIFPNPTRNMLHLPQELSTQNLKLYNSQGQQFEVVQTNKAKLDVSHLARGMYVLQAGERVWRFVKE